MVYLRSRRSARTASLTFRESLRTERQVGLLDQLLGDGRAALEPAAGGVVGQGPDGRGDVEAAVLEEAVVLGVEHRGDQHLGHLVEGDRLALLRGVQDGQHRLAVGGVHGRAPEGGLGCRAGAAAWRRRWPCGAAAPIPTAEMPTTKPLINRAVAAMMARRRTGPIHVSASLPARSWPDRTGRIGWTPAPPRLGRDGMTDCRRGSCPQRRGARHRQDRRAARRPSPYQRPTGVPGRPVRRRAGLRPLSGGLRRAGALAPAPAAGRRPASRVRARPRREPATPSGTGWPLRPS